MALVSYSDSESSDNEASTVAPARPSKPTPSNRLERTESRKIKVELPSIRPEPSANTAQEPPQKRARTAGAFSGFNSFLPAPKKTAQNTPKVGVSLKTSSEAAFSRAPAPRVEESEDVDFGGSNTTKIQQAGEGGMLPAPKFEEPKIVGKPTRFMPLSVANARKKKKPKENKSELANRVAEEPEKVLPAPSKEPELPPAPKPKRSLFSISTEETAPTSSTSTDYEPEFVVSSKSAVEESLQNYAPNTAAQTVPDHAEGMVEDLNLTPAQRRQLFGRQGKDQINITHFNMDAEYRNNQELAAKGEVLEHRAVKAIAPGKHSLQQLVNNARTQTDALEDKWAEGRRARGEGGSKYGWGR